MDAIIETLARELGRTEEHVQNVVNLIDEGATIPFIARYRKELHGSMDDQLLRELADRLQYLRNLDARKAEVKTSIENQGKLTEELAAAIDSAATLAEVEDLYRPYKQKRRTRATIAREKGLEPLAALAFAFGGGICVPSRGPATSLPSSSLTTPISARSCAPSTSAGRCWCPGRRTRSRRTRSTACTTTSSSR